MTVNDLYKSLRDEGGTDRRWLVLRDVHDATSIDAFVEAGWSCVGVTAGTDASAHIERIAASGARPGVVLRVETPSPAKRIDKVTHAGDVWLPPAELDGRCLALSRSGVDEDGLVLSGSGSIDWRDRPSLDPDASLETLRDGSRELWSWRIVEDLDSKFEFAFSAWRNGEGWQGSLDELGSYMVAFDRLMDWAGGPGPDRELETALRELVAKAATKWDGLEPYFERRDAPEVELWVEREAAAPDVFDHQSIVRNLQDQFDLLATAARRALRWIIIDLEVPDCRPWHETFVEAAEAELLLDPRTCFSDLFEGVAQPSWQEFVGRRFQESTAAAIAEWAERRGLEVIVRFSQGRPSALGAEAEWRPTEGLAGWAWGSRSHVAGLPTGLIDASWAVHGSTSADAQGAILECRAPDPIQRAAAPTVRAIDRRIASVEAAQRTPDALVLELNGESVPDRPWLDTLAIHRSEVERVSIVDGEIALGNLRATCLWVHGEGWPDEELAIARLADDGARVIRDGSWMAFWREVEAAGSGRDDFGRFVWPDDEAWADQGACRVRRYRLEDGDALLVYKGRRRDRAWLSTLGRHVHVIDLERGVGLDMTPPEGGRLGLFGFVEGPSFLVVSPREPLTLPPPGRSPGFDDEALEVRGWTARFDDGEARVVERLAPWEWLGHAPTGTATYRAKFDLDEVSGAVLLMAEANDLAELWVNDVPLGVRALGSPWLTWEAPPNVVRVGSNTVQVRVHSSGGGHGPAGLLWFEVVDHP